MAIKDDKRFDDLRQKAAKFDTAPEKKELLLDLISEIERTWNKMLGVDIDITKHDEHGRVEIEVL